MRKTGGDSSSIFRCIEHMDAHLPQKPIRVLSERAGGSYRNMYILRIWGILYVLTYSVNMCTVLMQRASQFSRSVCETFAFSTSETVSISSGNSLIQAVGNVCVYARNTQNTH